MPPANHIRPAATPVVPVVDYKALKVNELGRIPVLMYHAIGGPSVGGGPRYDKLGLNIRPETFQKQLEMMRAAGWYPINMRDALTPRIDAPAGKIPVVLTFDDARGSQFHFLKDGSLDRTCAVAIMEKFHTEHPDWPMRATFYVMGQSKWNPVPFYQPATEAKKLQYLVQHGYEVGNHSTSHRSFRTLSPDTLTWEMAECARYVRERAPEATMDTLALPYGSQPKKKAQWGALLKGTQGGTSYENRCILLAWGDPSYPPAHKKFDRMQITRMGSEPGFIEDWIKNLKPGREVSPYISDGDPNTLAIPRSAEPQLNRASLSGVRLVTWDDIPPSKAKPARSAKKSQAGSSR